MYHTIVLDHYLITINITNPMIFNIGNMFKMSTHDMDEGANVSIFGVLVGLILNIFHY